MMRGHPEPRRRRGTSQALNRFRASSDVDIRLRVIFLDNAICIGEVPSPSARLRMTGAADDPSLFVTHHEVNHAGGVGNPETVEVFPQLLDFVTARNTVDF
jgi:hypothetical protein